MQRLPCGASPHVNKVQCENHASLVLRGMQGFIQRSSKKKATKKEATTICNMCGREQALAEFAQRHGWKRSAFCNTCAKKACEACSAEILRMENVYHILREHQKDPEVRLPCHACREAGKNSSTSRMPAEVQIQKQCNLCGCPLATTDLARGAGRHLNAFCSTCAKKLARNAVQRSFLLKMAITS